MTARVITLRDDQEAAVNGMRAALSSHRSILLQAPTGFGKTVVAAYMAQQASARGRRVIFGVHRRELAEQTSATFAAFGIRHGFIASGRPANPMASVQIASADTLVNRVGALAGCNLFVPDEAHLWAAPNRARLIGMARDAGSKIAGLSATPERLDGRPLGDLFDFMVEGPSVESLIAKGALSSYRAFAPSSPDLTGIRSSRGDYATGQVEERLDKPSITGDAVEMWKRLAGGKRTIVFAISRRHGQHVAESYNAAGVPTVYIDGDTSPEERRHRIAAFADGRASVLVNIQLCTEGFDLSAQVGRNVPIEAVQVLRPTQSLALAMQMLGRALRPKPEPAIILDHVNLFRDHGYPDDDREWSLDGRAVKKQVGVAAFNTWTCETCFGAVRATAAACPYCETVRERGCGRQIEVVDGDLIEVQREVTKLERRRAVSSARDIESVAAVCVANGYKPGWIMTRMTALRRPVSWSKAMESYADARARLAVAC